MKNLPFPIIDCHCHAGKGDGLTGPWDTAAPLSRFLKWSAEAGISRTNLFAAFHSDYSVANFEVAKIVATQPRRFSGFAFVNAEADRGRIFKMVKKALDDWGFCGIKCHRHDARISREICETAKNLQIPVLYDVMGEVSTVELLAVEYPTVNFIIPHLGSFADDWRAQIALIPLLERHPNVFTDTSGIRRFDVLEMAARRAGPSKILFGSDGPWLHPGVELAKIFALHLSENGLRQVLSDNFLRLTSQVLRHRTGQMPPVFLDGKSTPELCSGHHFTNKPRPEQSSGVRFLKKETGQPASRQVFSDPWLAAGAADF